MDGKEAVRASLSCSYVCYLGKGCILGTDVHILQADEKLHQSTALSSPSITTNGDHGKEHVRFNPCTASTLCYQPNRTACCAYNRPSGGKPPSLVRHWANDLMRCYCVPDLPLQNTQRQTATICTTNRLSVKHNTVHLGLGCLSQFLKL